mmetsp:Transcript_55003/g.125175  ORF Transcript_55003/g.125175 Transcript_55003/m.125175 type:complete len:285 (-) Transcript_55003:182-1036(-)
MKMRPMLSLRRHFMGARAMVELRKGPRTTSCHRLCPKQKRGASGRACSMCPSKCCRSPTATSVPYSSGCKGGAWQSWRMPCCQRWERRRALRRREGTMSCKCPVAAARGARTSRSRKSQPPRRRTACRRTTPSGATSPFASTSLAASTAGMLSSTWRPALRPSCVAAAPSARPARSSLGASAECAGSRRLQCDFFDPNAQGSFARFITKTDIETRPNSACEAAHAVFHAVSPCDPSLPLWRREKYHRHARKLPGSFLVQHRYTYVVQRSIDLGLRHDIFVSEKK